MSANLSSSIVGVGLGSSLQVSDGNSIEIWMPMVDT